MLLSTKISVFKCPFGMIMPERSTSTDSYRYAYNGMEADNEVSGNGNSYTTEFRQYDARLGRWKSLDPLMGMFPHMSPYVAFDNNPVYYTDIYGLSAGGPGSEGANEGGGAGDKGGFRGFGDALSIATGKETPGVGADFGSRKIPMHSPGGTPINNPQPIYDEIGANTQIKRRVEWTDEQLLADLEGLMNEFAWSGHSKKIVKGMYDHFKENTGEPYSSWDLTQSVNAHESVNNFKQDIEDAFQEEINAGGDYLTDSDFSIDEHLEGKPHLDNYVDNIDGLRISVNDVWTYDVKVVTYQEVDDKWEAVISLTLYDHFGLDIPDITNNQYATYFPAFYSWYILQWARGYNPFVTIMHIPQFTISGTLKK